MLHYIFDELSVSHLVVLNIFNFMDIIFCIINYCLKHDSDFKFIISPKIPNPNPQNSQSQSPNSQSQIPNHYFYFSILILFIIYFKNKNNFTKKFIIKTKT